MNRAQPGLLSMPGNPCPDGAIVGEVTASDGISLRFARWPARVAAKGTVCVFTGRSEAIEKYFETVGDLLARGFAVAAMDWRGQGHSQRLLADPVPGHVERYADYEEDLAAFMQGIVLPDCPPPYIALAHSMGGAILLRSAHAARGCFERMALSAPLVDLPRRPAGSLLRALIKAAHSAGFGRNGVPGSNVDRSRAKGFPGNPLTTDPARYARNAALIAADPELAVGSPTFAWLNASFDAVMAFREGGYAERIQEPVLMVAAGGDSIVSTPAIKAFAGRLSNGTLHVIDGARHELLQEQDVHRAEFWAAFDAFVAMR